MKYSDSDIVFDLTLKDDGFQVTMRDAVRNLRILQGELNKSAVKVDALERNLHNSRGAFRDMLMSVAAARYALQDLNDIFVALPSRIAKTTGEFQRLNAMLMGLSEASTEAGKIKEAQQGFDSIIGIAKNAPFEVKTLSDAFIKLKIAGLDPASGSLQTLVDSIAKFGGSSENLQRAAVAIQQMTGKGVISMEELRQQLGEAMPNAMRLMARGMGVTMAELTDKVSKGAVGAEFALKKMFIQMRIDAEGAAADLMNTYPGALSRLKTSIELFEKEIGSQGFVDVLVQQMQELVKFMESAEGVDFARTIGQGLAEATRNVAAFVKAVMQYSDEIISLAKVAAVWWGATRARTMFEGVIAQFKSYAETARKANLDLIESNRRAVQSNEKKIEAMTKEIAQSRALFEVQRESIRLERSESAKRVAAKNLEIQQLIALEKQLAVEQMKSWKRNRDRDQFDRTDDRRAIINANVEALKREIAEEQARRRALNLSAVEMRSVTNATNQGIESKRQAIEKLEKMNAALNGMNTGAKVAANAVKGFVLSLASTIAAGAAVVGAIELIAFAWDKVTGSAKRAAEAQERAARIKAGGATQEDVDKKNAEAIDLNNYVSKIKRNIDAQEKGRQLPREDMIGGVGLQGLRDLLTQKQVELARVQAEVKRATADVQNSKITQEITGLNNAFAQKVAEASNAAVARDDLGKMQAELEGVKGSSKEDEKKRADIRERIKQRTIQEIEAQKRARDEALVEVTKSAKGMGYSDAAIKQFVDEQAKSDLARFESDIAAMDADPIRPGKPKDKGSKKKPGTTVENSVTKLIARAEGEQVRIIERMGNLLEGSRTAEGMREEIRKKYQEMLDDGFYPDEVTKVTDKNGKTTETRRAITMDDLKSQIDAEFLREVAQSYDSLNEKTRTMGARIDADLSSSMNRAGDNSAKMSEGMRTLEREIAGINSSMATFIDFLRELETANPELAKKFEEAGITEASIRKRNSDVTQEMRDKQARSDANNFYADNKLEVEALQDSLLSQTEQRKRYWDREIKRSQDGYQRMIQGLSVESEEYVRLTEQRDQKLAALRELRLRDEQGALAQLTRSWKEDYVLEIQNMSANWGRTFIDNMVSGMTGQGFKLRDMVVQMLTDALRVNLQTQYADITNQIFGGIANKVKEIAGIGGGTGTGSAAAGVAMSAEEMKNKVDATSAALQSMGITIDRDVITTMIQQAITGTSQVTATMAATYSLVALTTAATNAASALVAVAASSGGGTDGWADAAGSIMDWFKFADGGIMSSKGSLPLKMYANGGVAKSPQVAVFGEGRMNEAFVPLPDGRSIPVSLSGGTGNNVTIQINVNESGDSVNASGNGKQDYMSMAERIKVVVREEMMKQKRPGGMLYG